MKLWETMTLFQRVLLLITAPFTVVLGIQFFMVMFGLAGSGGDSDFDGDGLPDTDVDGDGLPDDVELSDGNEPQEFGGVRSAFGAVGGLKLLTFRGIMAFFAIGGWTALAVSMAAKPVWSVAAGIAAGAAADVIYALLMKLAMRLQESGNVQLSNAVGLNGEVYIPIPPKRAAPGRITVELQGKLCEIDAVSDEAVFLKTGEPVTVREALKNMVVVAPAGKEEL